MPTLDTIFRRTRGSRPFVRVVRDPNDGGGGPAGSYPDLEFIETHHDTIQNFANEPTILSVGHGDWSDPATWDDNRVPEEGDVVGIQHGHTVTYDVESTDVIAAIGVAGKLAFDPAIDTELWVQNLIVYGPHHENESENYGELEIGTSSAPVDATKTATIVFPDAALVDENTGGVTGKEYSNGLLCFGALTVHGAAKTPYVRSDDEIDDGDTALAFGSQSGWRVGDRIIIPDTRPFHDNNNFPFQVEERTLATVASTSATVAALDYDHHGARDKDGTLDFTPHIANLTRNVVFKSENPDGVRGHAMVLFRALMDVRYATFLSMGRTKNASLPNTTTNQKGRYPFHVHHVYGPVGGLGYDASIDPDEFKPADEANLWEADGPQFRFIGNVVDDESEEFLDMKWGLTLHESSDGLVKQNVVYKATGSSFMCEDGTEVYNVYDGNFSCLCDGTADRGDAGYVDGAPGREGQGYTFPNMQNWIRNNISYNAGGLYVGVVAFGTGFHTFAGESNQIGGLAGGIAVNQAMKLREFPGANPEEDYLTGISHFPILEFADNEVCGTDIGYTNWFIGAGYRNSFTDIEESVILRFKSWNARNAVFNYPNCHTTYRECVFRHRISDLQYPTVRTFGVGQTDYQQRLIRFVDCDIQGFKTGIGVPYKCGDVDDPNSATEDGYSIEGCTLCNYWNVLVLTMLAVTGGGNKLSPRVTNVSDTDFFTPDVTEGDPVPRRHLRLKFETDTGLPPINWIQSDKVFIYEGCTFDGVALTEDRRFYFTQSAGSYVTPQSTGSHVGSPDSGKTNTQNLADNGVCVCGAIAPTTNTQSGCDGYYEAV